MHGYAVLERNVRTPHGEIDILARKGRNLHVVEVKSRRGGFEGDVGPAQLQRLRRAALWLHHALKNPGGVSVDLLTVTHVPGKRLPEIRHYPAVVEED